MSAMKQKGRRTCFSFYTKMLHKVAVKKFSEMSHKYYMLYYIIIFVTFKDVKSP